MFIFNLHCQLFLRISGNILHKNKPQCKIPVVPEEGWFGQPKYRSKNPVSKKHFTLCRFLPFYSSCITSLSLCLIVTKVIFHKVILQPAKVKLSGWKFHL